MRETLQTAKQLLEAAGAVVRERGESWWEPSV